jgi:hypothetical protein
MTPSEPSNDPGRMVRMPKLRHHDRLIAASNAFGALDLVLAVTVGIMSGNGSPLQLIHAGVGTAAMTTLQWSLVPRSSYHSSS